MNCVKWALVIQEDFYVIPALIYILDGRSDFLLRSRWIRRDEDTRDTQLNIQSMRKL